MIRVLAALAVLLALQFAPGVGVGEAQARCTSPADNACDTIEEAHALAVTFQADQNWWIARCTGTFTGMRIDHVAATKEFKVYAVGSGGCGGQRIYGNTTYLAATCSVGVWDEATMQCFDSAQCLAQPPLGSSKVTGVSSATFTACQGGCAYEPSGTGAMLLDEATGTWFGPTTGWEPSGQACAVGDPVPEPLSESQLCAPSADGQTICLKPNGQHCYSASSGRQICWSPGETGEKTDGPILQVRNAGDTAVPPATMPPPGETFQQEGESVTQVSNVSGQQVTTTTTNYKTVNGTDAGGENSGEPGDGSGGGEGDGDGHGTVGDGVGDFYEGEGDTLEGVWGDFKNRVMAAPIMAASAGFLTFSGTASCPTWTVPETAYWPEMTATWLCTGALADAMAFAGWLVLAGWAYLGFKIAVY